MKPEIKHSVITKVRTGSRDYTVSISGKGVRVSAKYQEETETEIRKGTRVWSRSWDEIDAIFDEAENEPEEP